MAKPEEKVWQVHIEKCTISLTVTILPQPTNPGFSL